MHKNQELVGLKLFQQGILSLIIILPTCAESHGAKITDCQKAAHLMFQDLPHSKNSLKNLTRQFFSKSMFLLKYFILANAMRSFNCSTK